MFTEILGLLGSVVNMIGSSDSNEKTQEEIYALREKNKISEALKKAVNMASESAAGGLPGYESIQSDIKSELPTTLNQMRDMVSGGTLTDIMTQLYTRQNKSLRDLDVTNEQAKIANKKNLQDLLSGAMAGAETNQLATEMSLGLTSAALQQQGTKDQMSYLNQLLGGAGKFFDSKEWSDLIAGLSGSGGGRNQTGNIDLMKSIATPSYINF